MQREADSALSNNEKEFIVQALKTNRRIDGRAPFEMRKPEFKFSLDDTSCTVVLGRTRVMTVVSASLEPPYPDRPNEGMLRFNVEFSPMASPAFEAGRPGEDATQVARLIERGLRESRAVDQEALVVVSGRKVWSLRVDVHVLDHGGNLADACGLSALAALMAFRRPDVSVGGEGEGQVVTVHPPDVREPLPLSIHHLPIPVSFAFFQGGELLVVDPSLKEEAASSGGLTLTLNPQGEVCAVQKAKGVGLPPGEIMRCMRLAAQQVEDVTTSLKKALEAHSVARVQARIRRREPQQVVAQRAQQEGAAVAAAAARREGEGEGAGKLLSPQVQALLARVQEVDDEEDEGKEEGSSMAEPDAGGADLNSRGAGGAVAANEEGEGEMKVDQVGDVGESQSVQVLRAGGPLDGREGAQGGVRVGEAGQKLGSAERRKEKRRGRAGGAVAAGAAQGDQFELIASMIAGAGRKGGQADAEAGLVGAVKPGEATGKRRTHS